MDYTKLLKTDKVQANVERIAELCRLAETLTATASTQKEFKDSFPLLQEATIYLDEASRLQFKNNRLLRRADRIMRTTEFFLRPILKK